MMRAFVGMLLDGFGSASLRNAYAAALGLLCFLFPFSMVFIVGDVLPPQFAWTASVIIVLTALVTLLSEMRHFPVATALGQFAALSLILFVVEQVGVRTGIPFGSYEYTGTLGLALFGVPVAISCAWYATVLNSLRVVEGSSTAQTRLHPGAVAIFAGLLTLAFDVVLEPMAASIHTYWIWHQGSVPLQNYLSWFSFSMLAVLWLSSHRKKVSASGRGAFASSLLVVGMQWILFALTNIVHGYVTPVLISLAIGGLILLPRAVGIVSPAGGEAPRK